METGLLHLHNLLRWVILLLLIASLVRSYSGWQQKRMFTAADRKTFLFTMIASHITLLLGIYQWLAGRYGIFTHTAPEGVSMMKNSFYRFFQLEHPLMMVIAIVLITMAHSTAKKPLPDQVRFRKAFWLFFIALVLILLGIPWPFRETIGRSLVPGM